MFPNTSCKKFKTFGEKVMRYLLALGAVGFVRVVTAVVVAVANPVLVDAKAVVALKLIRCAV